MSLEKSIIELTAAMLTLAESNIAQHIKTQTNSVASFAEEVEKPKRETKAQKHITISIDKANEEADAADAKEHVKHTATANDCRKVAQECITQGKKADFHAALKKVAGAGASITSFEKDGGDLDLMLAALEEALGTKLEDIAD